MEGEHLGRAAKLHAPQDSACDHLADTELRVMDLHRDAVEARLRDKLVGLQLDDRERAHAASLPAAALGAAGLARPALAQTAIPNLPGTMVWSATVQVTTRAGRVAVPFHFEVAAR